MNQFGLQNALILATRLTPGFSICYPMDLRWLVRISLVNYLSESGFNVLNAQPSFSSKKQKDMDLTELEPLIYFDDKGRSVELDAGFCFKYGFSGYSLSALNYRCPRRSFSLPADYVTAHPISLGNFAFIVSGKIQKAPNLPNLLNANGTALTTYGRNGTAIAYLGVRFNSAFLAQDIVLAVNELPEDTRGWVPVFWRKSPSMYITKFMQYYGHLSDDEVALRKQLGFVEKGKIGVSEEILYRSCVEIFGTQNVARRYRGKELDGLELDVWVPRYRLAFEYQGEQHFKPMKHWHGKPGLRTQQARDAKKVELCRKLGYHLLCLKPDDDLSREALLDRIIHNSWIEPLFLE